MNESFDDFFCFQCEQTAGGRACSGRAGVCGKQKSAAVSQDRLTAALIGLARAAGGEALPESLHGLVMEGLFATVTNVNFDDDAIEKLTERVREEKMLKRLPAGGDYDMAKLWEADEDERSLKSLILFGLRGIAAYALHARALGHTDGEVNDFFGKALAAIGEDGCGMEKLLPLVMETGRINLKCMDLLDRANTGAYGVPKPTSVQLSVEKGPFVVVSGHDLHDLALLLEQTRGRCVNVYTHGEMLPAHAYPELKKYPQLKGNFGTAWQNQQKEFDGVPAPVLFTTNCLMPVRDGYRDRVFTTSVVHFPGAVHIGENKDFTPVINKALELGGYPEKRHMTGINGGDSVMTGFGHGAVLSAADTIVSAVKSKAIRHFFLVGGCDGARPGRNYYTDFVKQTPPDTLVLTLACGKYRFNDLDIGQIAGLPRILDMGQCNDAWSAVKVALALSEAFNCGVNDLPLTLVLSWYEQKAVSILLSLLHLGIKNILLGPSLPAFVSPNVLSFLVEKYGIRPISTPAGDLAMILGKRD
ncbi:MAG: hydroxylamine reductase [Desulfovibrio sp.]|jgi:hydroxylamine reductase|nr:hydroxylamine reductase [Desulfovibrio sp.]